MTERLTDIRKKITWIEQINKQISNGHEDRKTKKRKNKETKGGKPCKKGKKESLFQNGNTIQKKKKKKKIT